MMWQGMRSSPSVAGAAALCGGAAMAAAALVQLVQYSRSRKTLAASQEEEDIMMEAAEIDVLKAFLTPDTVMFEYGSGGSTKAFAPYVARLYSAEHSDVWSAKVEAECRAANLNNVTMLSASPNKEAWQRIGATKVGIFAPQVQCGSDMRVTMSPNLDPAWRNASTEERTAVFADYIQLIARTGEKRFDVVLVDGRVRGECAIAALPYVDDKSVVIIHDWHLEELGYVVKNGELTSEICKVPPRCTLPSYKRVLEHYDVVAEVSPSRHPQRCSRSGLVVLRKKQKV